MENFRPRNISTRRGNPVIPTFRDLFVKFYLCEKFSRKAKLEPPSHRPRFLIKQRREPRSRGRDVNRTEVVFTFKGEDTSENESGATFDNLSGQRLNGYRFFANIIEPRIPPSRKKPISNHVNHDYLSIRCFTIGDGIFFYTFLYILYCRGKRIFRISMIILIIQRNSWNSFFLPIDSKIFLIALARSKETTSPF